ncbi:unnamed protein product [Effrenium voratum]|nr:unnamed protein product [Effrenium voratum]
MKVSKQPTDGAEASKKESKKTGRLMAVIVLVLTIPSGVTGYLSYMEGSACANKRDECKEECFQSYVNADRQFQSQMKGEMECYDDCDAELVRCSGVSTNLLFGAIFLAGGVVVAFCVNIVIPHVVGSEEDDGFSYEVRAAYVEPFPSEEQKRKKEQDRHRFFWQDKFQPPDIVEIVG